MTLRAQSWKWFAWKAVRLVTYSSTNKHTPWLVSALRYTAAAYATSEPSPKPCSWSEITLSSGRKHCWIGINSVLTDQITIASTLKKLPHRESSQPIFNLYKSWKSLSIGTKRGEIKPRGSYNLATTLSTVRLFMSSSLANSTSQSNRKTKVYLSMFQFNPRIFFSLETDLEQLWTPHWVCV